MHKASATVATKKASRYLQALCGHFDRKVNAEWNAEEGNVAFGFSDCQMKADDVTLTIHISSEDAEGLARAKSVVGGHLEEFAAKDNLVVVWEDID